MTRLGHIELFVADPLASRSFYTEVLGFAHVTTQGDTFVWLESNGTEILLRPGEGSQRGDTYQSASSALVLYTDNLSDTRKDLEQRGVEIRGTDGSPDCLTFTDPDGNWLQLVNPEG
jgi:catechol 2,3-dioxygenase-like lactoylglutathione lyase family enzyme